MAQELKSNDQNNQSKSLLAGKVIILDGPPASGKGSIAQYLNSLFGCLHISTGDIFRKHVQQNTELGRQVKKYLDMKSFVPDALVVNHVLDCISQPNAKKFGCILDGFPRTPAQHSALQKANLKIDQVITIQCPDKVLLKRAKGRRIDTTNGKIYHIDYVPAPKNINVIKRDMDNNIKTRLDVYHAQHRRFKFDNAININGNKPIKEVFADVINILKAMDSELAHESVEIDNSNAQVKPSECTICLDKPSDYIIIPCGHQCGCKECLTKLKQTNSKCPICRGPIRLVQKVYATHNVIVPKKKKPIGAPKMQQIENAEEQILIEDVDDDEEKWPEDVDDDEDEKKGNSDGDITVKIAPGRKDVNGNVYDVVLELCGSTDKGRCPVDICAVLDTSGSMCSSAAVQEDDGSVKNDDGLSVLDLVKHSIKTIIHCLEKNDRLSIVSFGSDANVQYPLNYMTKNGMKKAVTELEKLTPGGQTNLWGGLRLGMESLRTKQKTGRLSVVMLLTDGRPTVIPPKGHIHELQKYIDMTNFAVQINTFGFGYDLDSELLHSLSTNGNGTFAFIPDAKIVGTTFVNSISNVLTTIAAETKIHLTAVNGSKFAGKTWGGHNEQNESWGRVIDIGSILCGSTRYISIPMEIESKSNKPFLECMIKTGILGARGKYNKINIIGKDTTVRNQYLAGHLTAKVVTITLEATQLAVKRKGNAAMKLLKTLKKEIKDAATIAKNTDTDDFDQMTANSRLEALNSDVSGRLNKAFMGETRFNRWGKHYIRALLRAHQLNICTNFMDPGLQVNGGNLFRTLRAKGDEVFINLPAPKPSRRTGPTQPVFNNNNNNNNRNNNRNNRRNNNNYNRAYNNYNRPAPAPAPAPAVDMSNYYGGSGGGCIAPFCNVIVMDINTKQYMTKQMSDIRPGDMIQCFNEQFANVLFVIELKRDKRKRMIELPGGLVITGGHPIKRNGIWCLPKEQNDAKCCNGCDSVFMVVLDKIHVIIVNGIECVTWGHGLNDNVVKNEFYGTDKVIEAVKDKLMDVGDNSKGEMRNRDVGNPLNNVICIYE